MLLAERAGRKLERRSNPAPRGMTVIAPTRKARRRNKIRPIGLLHLNLRFLACQEAPRKPPQGGFFYCCTYNRYNKVVYTMQDVFLCKIADYKLIAAMKNIGRAGMPALQNLVYRRKENKFCSKTRESLSPAGLVLAARNYCSTSTTCKNSNFSIS